MLAAFRWAVPVRRKMLRRLSVSWFSRRLCMLRGTTVHVNGGMFMD